MQVLNFQNDRKLNQAMKFFRKVNESIIEEHGQGFDMDAPKNGGHFVVNDTNSKFNGAHVKLNATVPSQEMFSLSQELVKSADEPFSARKVFAVDNGFHEGSKTVGFDVETESGEAKLVATGQTAKTISRADFRIGRNLNFVGKIMTSIEVTRDDVQEMDLRGKQGLAPFVDLMGGKLEKARKHIQRAEDQIAWLGGDIENTSDGEVPGLFNRLSTVPSDFNDSTPAFGKRVDGLDVWAPLGVPDIDKIMEHLIEGVQYITRTNSYFPNLLALPPAILFGEISFARTSNTDSTPLVEWIKRAFKNAFDKELQIIATTAMSARDVAGTTRGNKLLANDAMLLMHADKSYQAIAEVEAMTLLPSKEDKQGTIEQVVQMKTGGLHVKHPGAMYLRDGIRAKA